MVRGLLMSVNQAMRALFASWLMALAVSAPAQEPPPLLITVERYDVNGDDPLDADTTAEAVAPFTGEFAGAGLDGLRAASDALESELRRRDLILHRVVLPSQELVGGTVTLEGLTFAPGDKRVTGNQRLDDFRVIAALPALAPGAIPNLREVSRLLAVANDHPGRQFGLNGWLQAFSIRSAVDIGNLQSFSVDFIQNLTFGGNNRDQDYRAVRTGNGGGDGGFIEVSGKENLVLQGSLDVGALNGRAGQLLLDPENITIISGLDATEVLDPSPSANDRFSGSFSILPNGNILVRNQDADVGGLLDAGAGSWVA
jgi:hypothetical protein